MRRVIFLLLLGFVAGSAPAAETADDYPLPGYPQPGYPMRPPGYPTMPPGVGVPPGGMPARNGMYREILLSECLDMPEFDERKDLVQHGNWFSITVGYKIRREFLMISYGEDGQSCAQSRVTREEPKFEKFQSRTFKNNATPPPPPPSPLPGPPPPPPLPLTPDILASAARDEVIGYYFQWRNPRRHFRCRNDVVAPPGT